MSINEKSKISYKNKVTSIDFQHKISESNETVAEPVVAANPNKKRRCSLCCEKGHYQYLFQRIKTNFDRFPLLKIDDAARNSLAKLLVLVIR